jgi:hypothetical protein
MIDDPRVPAEVRAIVKRYEAARARHLAAKGDAIPPATTEARLCERMLAEAVRVIGSAVVVDGYRYHVVGFAVYRTKMMRVHPHGAECRPTPAKGGAS